MKRTLLEALGILLAGTALALLANGVSPRGLSLTRNYFPAVGSPRPTQVHSGFTNELPNVLLKLGQAGLRPVGTAEVHDLFVDPRYQQNFVIFIDARNDDNYHSGHIPGAWQFNYYRPEPYLPTVLPLAQVAHEIVVYCTGGDCEDSQLAATFLVDTGIPRDKISVYTGGIKEWIAAGFPLETGPRGSGRTEEKGKK